MLAFLIDVSKILGLAGAIALLSQWLRQPLIIGYMITGVLIGSNYFPDLHVSNLKQIELFSSLGVIFLMFVTGLEFSFHKLKEVGAAAIIAGLVKVGLTIFLGVSISYYWHWSFFTSLFFWSALSVSSTTVILKIFDSQNLQRKRFAELVLGILIIEDLLAVIILTSLSTVITTNHLFSFKMLLATLKLISTIGSWFVLGRFLVPWFFRHILTYLNAEILTIIALALCFALTMLATYLNYSEALGAFIMGSILAETPQLAKRIKQLILPMRDLLVAVFFLSVGMNVDLNSVGSNLSLILWSSGIIIVMRILVTFIGALLTGSGLKDSVKVSMSMAPVGEFSFIIMGLGVSLKVVDRQLLQVMIGISVITTFVSPYLMQASMHLANWLEDHLANGVQQKIADYSNRVSLILASDQPKHEDLRYQLIGMIVNSVLIALVFIMGRHFMLPKLITYLTSRNIAMGLSWAITMVMCLPMIKQIITVPLSERRPAFIFAVNVVLLAELIILSSGLLGGFAGSVITVAGVGFIVVVAHKQLLQLYNYVNERLLKRYLASSTSPRFDALALMDEPPVICVVTNAESPLLHKSLAQLRVRENYGVNILSIGRGLKVITSPKSNATIELDDELVLQGQQDDLETFRALVESENTVESSDNQHAYALTSLQLEDGNAAIGKTVSGYNLEQQSRYMIVGVERNGDRILNPNPKLLLREGDVLLLLDLSKSGTSLSS